MLYYKANSNRNIAFQTYVEILEDGRVCKGALNQEAKQHIHAIYEHAKKLAKLSPCFDLNYQLIGDQVYCNLAKGTSLSEILVGLLKDKEYDALESMVEKYLHIISDLLVEVPFMEENSIFGKINYHEELTYTNISNLDFNFDNIFVDEEGFKVIDCEWLFSTILPKEFISFRSLLYFYSKYSALFIGYKSFVQWIKTFHIHYLDEYMAIEEHFQQYVYGNNREANLEENYFINNKKNINKEEPSFIQLYYDLGEGLSETNSYIQPIQQGNTIYRFELNQHIHNLRIDVLNKSCLVKINSIQYACENQIESVELTNCIINGYQDNNCILYMIDDPQLYISHLDKFILNIEIDFEIIRMPHESDFNLLAGQILEKCRVEQLNQFQSLEIELNRIRQRADYMANHPFKNLLKGGIKE